MSEKFITVEKKKERKMKGYSMLPNCVQSLNCIPSCSPCCNVMSGLLTMWKEKKEKKRKNERKLELLIFLYINLRYSKDIDLQARSLS